MRRNKFGAIRTEIDGVVFASKREARRYQELKLLERAGHINELELQPTYSITINQIDICKVKLDFRYRDMKTGESIIEDVKGGEATKTPVSRLKHKLLYAVYGVRVRYT